MADQAVADQDGELGADEERQASGKMPGKKLVLLIVLPILLLVGGGAGAYFAGLLDPLLGKSESEEEVAAEEPEPEAVIAKSVFYDLPEILVNLNAGGRKVSYLKIVVSLELEDGPDLDRINEVLPRIIDNFQVYLRELRVEDLSGSAGLQRLREELLLRVNTAAHPAVVKDVLFKEMLVQ